MLEERKQKVPKTPKKHESYLFYPFIRPEEMLAQARGGTLVHWCNRINSCEALHIFVDQRHRCRSCCHGACWQQLWSFIMRSICGWHFFPRIVWLLMLSSSCVFCATLPYHPSPCPKILDKNDPERNGPGGPFCFNRSKVEETFWIDEIWFTRMVFARMTITSCLNGVLWPWWFKTFILICTSIEGKDRHNMSDILPRDLVTAVCLSAPFLQFQLDSIFFSDWESFHFILRMEWKQNPPLGGGFQIPKDPLTSWEW